MFLVLTLLGCGGGDEPADGLSCGETDPGERLLRRLTHDEYRRTVADLTGVTVDAQLAADPVVEGFRNDAHALVVSGLLADQYRTTAEAVGEAFDVPGHLTCDPGAGELDCATIFVKDFGLRAFRRPLSDADVTAYLKLWGQISLEADFATAIRWVVIAMLQSPHFLYRSELGARQTTTTFALTDWEVASALSYSLWGTMPDDELLQAAAGGKLSDDADIDAQVERMIADPRAHDTVARFVEAWLDLDRLETVPREGLTPELRQQMAEQTRARVAQWVDEGGTLATLLADDGLLTDQSVLTTHARPDGSSPVHRGVLVRERLLCEDLPPPPANLDTSPPEVDPTRSTRERYLQHATDRGCSSCHDLIDPVGFAFEHYDQLGRWRDDDNGHPIDTTGHVDDVPFEGTDGLSQVLLDDDRFRSCFVYTWRRHVRGTHACGADLGTDVPLLEPLVDVLFTWGFRNRLGGPAERDTLAVGRGGVDLPPAPGPTGTRFELTINNDWGAGYCANGSVANEGSAPVTWSGRMEVDGQIDNIWSADYQQVGGYWEFTGVDRNATLDPGEDTTFGFCAHR